MNKISFYRPELDALRFLAFMLVFVHHTVASVGGPVAFNAGSYGVDLFFLLSAYLITELFRREEARSGSLDISKFYWRRILRIWPLYFSFIAAVALTALVIHQIQMPAAATMALLFFYGNWYLTSHPLFSPAGILWSVSVEEQFYVAAPWLIRLLSKRMLILAMVGLIIVAAGVRFILVRAGAGDGLWFNTATHLDPIAVGVLLALLLKGRTPQISGSQRVVLVLLGIGTLWIAFSTPALLSYPIATLGALSLFLAFFGARITWSPAIYLGRISYGLYVFHLLALNVSKEMLLRLAGECPWWARGAIALPATIALAAASYRWLETPFLRLKDRMPEPWKSNEMARRSTLTSAE